MSSVPSPAPRPHGYRLSPVTKDVVVVPHPDAVPWRGIFRYGSCRTFGYRPARSRCGPPAVTPPWIPAPHRRAGIYVTPFSPVRRCGGWQGYFHTNHPCRLPPAPPIMKMGRSPGPRRNGRGFGIPAPVDPLYPGEIAGEESGWGMNASDSSATLGMTFS